MKSILIVGVGRFGSKMIEKLNELKYVVLSKEHKLLSEVVGF